MSKNVSILFLIFSVSITSATASEFPTGQFKFSCRADSEIFPRDYMIKISEVRVGEAVLPVVESARTRPDQVLLKGVGELVSNSTRQFVRLSSLSIFFHKDQISSVRDDGTVCN